MPTTFEWDLLPPPAPQPPPELLERCDAVYLIELPRRSMYLNREHCANRGRRMGGGRGVVIGQIPASVNLKNSALVVIRQKASAGKIAQVEEYTTR